MRNTTQIKNRKQADGLAVVVSSPHKTHRSINLSTPQALIQIGKKTLIEHQVSTIQKAYPNAEIIITVGYQANKIYEQLKKYNIRLVYNSNFDIANSLYDLGLALYVNICPKVLYIDGNLLFSQSIFKSMDEDHSSLVINNQSELEDCPGITINNKYVSHLSVGLNPQWAKIAFFTGHELELMQNYALQTKLFNRFVFEGLNKIIDNGGNFITHEPIKYNLMEINSIDDVELAKKVFK